jgi:hypothetical protein
MAGMPGFADMNYILVANVEPVNGKAEFGMVTFPKAEIFAEPVAGSLRIMGQNEEVLKKSKRHLDSCKN